MSSGTDNSETEIPETVIEPRINIPKTDMPPPPAVRRGDPKGATPNGKKKAGNFATPPVPGSTSRRVLLLFSLSRGYIIHA